MRTTKDANCDESDNGPISSFWSRLHPLGQRWKPQTTCIQRQTQDVLSYHIQLLDARGIRPYFPGTLWQRPASRWLRHVQEDARGGDGCTFTKTGMGTGLHQPMARRSEIPIALGVRDHRGRFIGEPLASTSRTRGVVRFNYEPGKVRWCWLCW